MDLLNALSVPRGLATFPRKWLRANCQPTDSVGDCVYISSEYSGGLYQVSKADPSDYSKMPAVGVIISKASAITCKVQFLGEMNGIYTGLTLRKPLFVGADARLTSTPPVAPVSGYAFVQNMGMAAGSTRVILVPNFFMVKRVW